MGRFSRGCNFQLIWHPVFLHPAHLIHVYYQPGPFSHMTLCLLLTYDLPIHWRWPSKKRNYIKLNTISFIKIIVFWCNKITSFWNNILHFRLFLSLQIMNGWNQMYLLVFICWLAQVLKHCANDPEIMG